MFKKIFNVIKKIFMGGFLFYLITGFVIIPLVLMWGIPSQGSKILKVPVKVRSVFFNPFLLQLNVNGLQIQNQDHQLMVGFNQLLVDVSFIHLVQGVYRVEKVQLDELQINPILLSNSRINLLDLVPTSASSKVDPNSSKPQPMPVVMVDKILLNKGKIQFQDQSIQPHFSTVLSDMTLTVEGFSTQLESQAKILFQAKLDEKGTILLEALVKPMKQPLAIDLSFNLNGYAMQVLSPYVGKYTGRTLGSGRLDVKMDYRIEDNQLRASHKLLIQHFEFGAKVESKDALPLPFGLAVALLEDPSGRINIALPVSGDMSAPEFHYWGLVGQVVRNFFMKLVTKPFSFLASVIGGSESGTDELGYVRFTPGSMDLSVQEEAKLKTLIEGLKQRPKLRLEINGSFDPEMDWKAIMTQTFNKDYTDLRKASSKADTVVYQQLYQRRFGIRALWEVAKKYKKAIGKYDEQRFNEEMKRQLIENAPADQGALDVLAQARAQKIYNAIIALGLDSNRLNIGQKRAAQASMGYVPLEFTLTVKE